MPMIAIVTGVVVLAGPFIALGLWLWLRSRRGPVPLAEPLDMGQVLGNTFAVFRPENLTVPLLALVTVGLPLLVWELVFPSTPLAQMHATRANPFAAWAALLTAPKIAAMLADFLLLSGFYVAAILFLVRRFELRPMSMGDALKAAPMLVLPGLVVALLAYAGIVIGMILLVVPGFVLGASWCIAIPVLVAERTGMARSFGRSRALAIGSRGRILLLGLLMLMLSFLLLAPLYITAGMFGMTVRSGGVSSVVRLIIGTISGSIHAAFFAALYVELRRIREGMAMPELAELFA